MVTSLRDGMNLVAFEYVACQQDNGVLLLSEVSAVRRCNCKVCTALRLYAAVTLCHAWTQFAGSAQSFSAAVMVNPWNISEMADGIKEGLELSAEDRHERYTLLYEYHIQTSIASITLN